jgi:plastocyanin
MPCRPSATASRPPLLASLLASLLAIGLQAAVAAPLAITVSTAAGVPVADAVVSVQVRGAPTQAAAGTTAQMAQRKKRFDPGVLAVQAGTAVAFPNLDTVRHHVYSFSPAKTFELKLYAATPAAPVLFDKPGTAVLGCNIHDTMAAFVRVVDTPYFGTTGADGKLVIDVPPGSHAIKVWHAGLAAEREPAAQPVTVAGGGSAVQLTAEGAP